MENVEASVKTKIMEVLKRPDLVIKSDTFLPQLPGWDSLKMMSVLVAIEKQFDFRFQAREVAQLKTFGDLAKLISAKIG